MLCAFDSALSKHRGVCPVLWIMMCGPAPAISTLFAAPSYRYLLYRC